MKIRLFAISVFVLATLNCFSGLFDTNENKIGKKNDTWFESNKSKIKFEAKSLKFSDDGKWIRLTIDGALENLSDRKITAIVVDFAITNNENNQEAIKRRFLIDVSAFKSETIKIPKLSSTKDSEFYKCMGGITNRSISYNLVTAIADHGDDSDSFISLIFWVGGYYKTEEMWR